MKEKKELDLEDLKLVTGGTGNHDCCFFVQALNKPSTNECDNCRYYNENESGNYDCTHPSNN